MIKAVFFDAIDTLFCPYPNKIEMYRRVIKKHTGLEVSAPQMSEVWAEILKENEEKATKSIGDDGILAWDNFNGKIIEQLGYIGDSREMGDKLLYEAWENENNFVLYNDVETTLNALRERQVASACVSNEMDSLYKFFVHFKIYDHFEFVLTSEEVGYEKPNPKIFNLALEKANLGPEEVIFVGDSLISDYNGAKNVGIKPLLIDRENKINIKGIDRISSLVEICNYIS